MTFRLRAAKWAHQGPLDQLQSPVTKQRLQDSHKLLPGKKARAAEHHVQVDPYEHLLSCQTHVALLPQRHMTLSTHPNTSQTLMLLALRRGAYLPGRMHGSKTLEWNHIWLELIWILVISSVSAL